MIAFEDRMLTCRDCSAEFTFTAGEQEFYQTKGLQHEPGRCQPCRTTYKQSRGLGEGRARREFHVTTCAECGQEARVPFLPRNDRPVYCSDCFDRVRETTA